MAIRDPSDSLIVNVAKFHVRCMNSKLCTHRPWMSKELDAETWKTMKEALEDFCVTVTFTGDDNKRHTIHMYLGDTAGKPLFLDGIFCKNYEMCKFNLTDCGWEGD